MGQSRINPNDNPMRGPRVVRATYADLFPPCAVDGCYDISETRDGLCDRHASDREWEQRRAERRMANGRG